MIWGLGSMTAGCSTAHAPPTLARANRLSRSVHLHTRGGGGTHASMLCCQPVRSPRAPLTSSQAYMASVSWTRACLSVQSASHDAHRPSGVRGVGARGSRLACSRLERGRDPVGKTAECCDLCGQLGSGLPCAVLLSCHVRRAVQRGQGCTAEERVCRAGRMWGRGLAGLERSED